MVSDPWRIYVEARKQARKVYRDALKVPTDAFLALDKEASEIYREAIEEARLAYKEASL